MHSPLGRRCGLLASGALILAALGTAGAFAAEPTTTSTIADASPWYTQAYENFETGGYLTPQQADVAGPQRAPYGTSSHKITIGESSAQTELYRTDSYDGAKLSDLTRLEYSELARHTGNGTDRQPVYLRLSVDNDGTDGSDAINASLFFYPANNADQQAVVNGEWQTWDVANGKISVDGDDGPGSTTTLADYVSAHPDAVLVNAPYDDVHDAGALSLIVGGSLGGGTDPQTNGEYFVDRVIVGQAGEDTLYDFGGGSEHQGDVADVTVDPAHLQGWKHQAYDNDVYLDSHQEFVDGKSAPAGGGSLKFTLSADENPDRVELFRTTQYDGTLVRDLRDVTYKSFTKADAGNTDPQQPVYLRLSVDDDGDGTTDDSLFYFPANNGTPAQDTWQSWNAGSGVWNIDGDSGQAVTLDDYVVAHPDATIVENADTSELGAGQPTGGVAFMVGGGGAGQIDASYYLDDVTISKVDDATGTTVSGKEFDLEPTAPTFSVGDASVTEGNKGATLTFPVTLSREFTIATTVHFSTSNGTAKAGTDYRATSGTVTIPAGSTSASVWVPVLSDKVREANETVGITLTSPAGATIADGRAVGTVVNDDTQVALKLRQATQHRVRVKVSTLAVAPGATVRVFRVTHSGATRLVKSTLDASGRLNIRLGHHYRPGTTVKMVAKVRVANGVYESETIRLKVRR